MTKPGEIAGVTFSAMWGALRSLREHIDETGQEEIAVVEVLTNRGDATVEEAQRLVSGMITAGFITAVDESGTRMFRLTERGARYATRRRYRISRDRRRVILARVLARVRDIAGNPDFAFEVTELALFGSALRDDLPDYGDVDLALTIDFKQSYPNRRRAIEVEERHTGISVADLEQGHPHLRVMRYLARRLPGVHLDELDDVRRHHILHRVLYSRDPVEPHPQEIPR